MNSRRRPTYLALLLVLLHSCAPAGPDASTTAALVPPVSPATAELGRVGGLLAITSDGSASYAIPLEAPPGRSGLQPELALRYDSRGGHGLFGMGWSLVGFPRITRCYQRQRADTIEPRVEAIDGFCLDGAELVEVGQTPDGRVYRTVPDSHAEIVALLDGPHWRVRTPDGRVYFLGTTENSRLAPPLVDDFESTVGWETDRVEDAYRNFMLLEYEKDYVPAPGDEALRHRLLRVRYTGHPLLESIDRQVVFTYEARPDVVDGYLRGLHLRQDSRVASIRMVAPDGSLRHEAGAGAPNVRPVREYNFAYTTSGTSPHSKLLELQDCALGASGTRACKPPQRYEWSLSNIDLIDPEALGAETDAAATPVRFSWPRFDNYDYISSVKTGDIDGDGTQEMVFNAGFTREEATLRVGSISAEGVEFIDTALSLANGWLLDIDLDGADDYVYHEGGEPGSFTLVYRRWEDGSGFGEPLPTGIALGGVAHPHWQDANGDDYPDLVYCARTTSGQFFWKVQLFDPMAAPSARFATTEPTPLTCSEPAPVVALPGEYGPILYRHSRSSSPLPAPNKPWWPIVADFDGDSTPDWLHLYNDSTPGARAPGVYRGNARIGYSFAWSLPFSPDDVSTVHAIDFNGDTLSDLLVLRDVLPRTQTFGSYSYGWYEGEPELFVNTGAGFRSVGAAGLAPGGLRMQAAHFAAAFVEDVNHDGRQDLVVPVADPGAPPVIPGDGHSTRWLVAVATTGGFQYQSGLTIPHAGLARPEYADWPAQPIPPVRIDVNGSGRSAYVFYDMLSAAAGGPGEVVFYRERVFRADLLTSISEGHSTTGPYRADVIQHIQYGPLKDAVAYSQRAGEEDCSPEVNCVPRASALVTASYVRAREVVNGLAGELVDQPHTRTEYRYAGGRIHRFGRGWLGFERTEEWRPALGVQVVRDYEPAARRVGARFAATPLPVRSTTRFFTRSRDGRPVDTSLEGLVRTNVTFDVRQLGSTFFTYVTGSTHTTEADGLQISHVERLNHDVDDWGNVRAASVEDGVRSDFFDAEFVHDDERFVHHLPDWTEERSRTPEAVAQSIRVEYAYEDTPAGVGLQLLRRRTMLSEPGARLEVVELGHDVFGNVEVVDLNDGAGRHRVTYVGHDDFEHMFPTELTYPDGAHELVSHHPVFGLADTHVDANGVTSTAALDGFGRPVEQRRTGAGWLLTKLKPGAVYPEVRLESATGAEARVLSDALGRTIASRTRRALDGAWVEGVVEYDPRTGLAARSSLPAPVGAAEHWVQWTYTDSLPPGSGEVVTPGLGRLRTVTDGAGATVTHAYEGLTHRWTDGDGHLFEERTNGRGEVLSRVAPPVDAGAGVTEYKYGPFGHLRVVRDAAGHETRLEHDATGLLVRSEDADRGVRTFEYDEFRELRLERHLGGAIDSSYEYDAAGRPVLRRDSGGGIVEETGWEWGECAAGNHSCGLLVRSTSPDHVDSEYKYDALGRLELRRLIGSDGTVLESRVASRDSIGRPTRVMLPDGPGGATVEMSQTFDSFGNVESVALGLNCREVPNPVGGGTALQCDKQYALWRLAEVDDAGRQRRTLAGNGVETEVDYDPSTGRLERLQTYLGPSLHQDFSVRYSPGGDVRARSTFAPGIGAYRTEELEYDSWHRLRFARVRDGEIDSGSTSWLSEAEAQYDQIDNLVFRSDTGPLLYESTGPHAVTSAGTVYPSGSLRYDARGNQVRAGTQERDFDLRGRLEAIDAPSLGSLRFDYNAEGELALTSLSRMGGGRLDIARIGDEYERRTEDGVVTHIYRAFVQGSAVAQLAWTDGGDPELVYLHRDLSGSTTLATDDTGAVVERFAYGPFGGRRDPDWESDLGGFSTPYPGFDELVTGPEAELGLLRMGLRHYDPATGQMLAPDPLVTPGVPADLNPYSFGWNNPLRYRDPTGLQEVLADHPGIEAITDPSRATGAVMVIRGALYISEPCHDPSTGERLPWNGWRLIGPLDAERAQEVLTQFGTFLVGRALSDARDAAAAHASVWSFDPRVGLLNAEFGDQSVPRQERLLESSWSDLYLNHSGMGAELGINRDSFGYRFGTVEAIIGQIAVGWAIGAAASSLAGGTGAFAQAAGGGVTTVYRVEGAVNQRLVVDAVGNVSVQGRNMLFLNFGDAARAEQFLATRVAQGMEGAAMKSFQVPTSFVDQLAASAVPEAMARQFPNAPLVVDVTRAANQFGLRPAQIEALLRVIIPGSGL